MFPGQLLCSLWTDVGSEGSWGRFARKPTFDVTCMADFCRLRRVTKVYMTFPQGSWCWHHSTCRSIADTEQSADSQDVSTFRNLNVALKGFVHFQNENVLIIYIPFFVFLCSVKKINASFWGKHARIFLHIVDFNGHQWVEGPNCSFYTILGKKKGLILWNDWSFSKKIYFFIDILTRNAHLALSLWSIQDFAHYVDTLERSRMVSSSSVYFVSER